MKTKLIFGIFVGLAAAMIATVAALAWGSDLTAFNQLYGTSNTRLNTCNACHPGGDTGRLNPYGSAEASKKTLGLSARDALIAIESLDSDGDGFTNIAEIRALTFPGDPNDHPVPTPTATVPPTLPPTSTRLPTSTPTRTSTPTSTNTPSRTSTPLRTSTSVPTATAPSTQIFTDVPPSHPYFREIEVLYRAGYTAGCSTNPLMYCPDATMNRAESSVFVERGIHAASYDPPVPTSQVFADLALDSWAVKWVTGLWNDQYTAGCGTSPLLYCPWQGHTRAEGCVFYLRMLNTATYEPPQPTQQTFVDVPLNTWYARWVQAAYDAGLIMACQTTPELRFCPDDPLTRGLAAYMMVHAKGLTVP